MRPDYRIPDPVDRLYHAPGEVAQFDPRFPDAQIGNKVPVLAIVAGYSRFVVGLAIPSRKTSDLLCGMELLLKRLGGVPKQLVWDNEPGIGRGRALTVPARVFAATAGTQIKFDVFGDKITAGAMMDRILHHAEVVSLTGSSYRLRIKKKAALPNSMLLDKTE